MQTHQLTHHLRRLAQNATALAEALEADARGETRGADERSALTEKLRTQMAEDFAAVSEAR